MLPITLTIAGAAALINIWLAIRVGQVRIAAKVMTGDGNVPALVARMRAQANFVESAPFVLILIGLIEYTSRSHGWLWAAGILFLVARILHPFGMDRAAASPLRMIGAVVTMLVLLGLAGYALALPYLLVEKAPTFL